MYNYVDFPLLQQFANNEVVFRLKAYDHPEHGYCLSKRSAQIILQFTKVVVVALQTKTAKCHSELSINI